MQDLAKLPHIGFGHVAHRRVQPKAHAFRYPTYFLLLPLRSFPNKGSAELARNRFGLISFYDRDHGMGGNDAVAWMDQVLVSQGIHDAQGELWLQTYPRVLGHAFKPVSLWYAYRTDGSLGAVVAEVNNTFGERHCYVLAGAELDGKTLSHTQKVFHVSPFNGIVGDYQFSFDLRQAQGDTAKHLDVRINLMEGAQTTLQTLMAGTLEPLTKPAAQRAFWGFPLMTLMVVLRIHLQAVRLALKRLPFFRKPAPPQQPVT
jgi:uncharacterized protein